MSDGRIDIVLPLAAKDIPRLRTLGASLRKFWHVPGCLRVFTPDADKEDVAIAVSRCFYLTDTFREIYVTPDSELLKRPARQRGGDGQGHWWQQQLVKIVAAEAVDTAFYMILDADCFAVRSIEHDDLVKNGRGLVGVSPVDEGLSYQFEASRPLWYAASRKILKIPEAPLLSNVNVTPFLMSQALALSLRNRLSTLYGPGWIGNLMMRTTSDDLHRECWTEYTLYELNARYAGLWDAFHAETAPIVGNGLWQVHQVDTWDARRSFEPDPAAPPFFFSLVQSHTSLPPEWAWERVKPFLTDD